MTSASRWHHGSVPPSLPYKQRQQQTAKAVQNTIFLTELMPPSPRIVSMSKIVELRIDDCVVKTCDSLGKTTSVTVRESFFCRAIPRLGDYLVMFDEGYISHRTSEELRRKGYLKEVKPVRVA